MYKMKNILNKNIKKLIALTLIIATTGMLNTISLARSIESTVTVINSHECPVLLKYKNIKIGTAYAVVRTKNQEYPAYCLDIDKPGVGEKIDKYDLNVNTTITNNDAYKAIINGYPYKTLKELGVETKEEAFTATKQAVYTMLHNRNIDDYFAVETEAGRRTYNAYRQIVTNARNTNKNYEDGIANFKTISNWKYNEKSNKLEYKFIVNGNKTGKLDLTVSGNEEKVINISKMNDINIGEEIVLTVNKENLNKLKNINIKANIKLNTLPVYFGETQKSGTQNYAISGFKVDNSITKEMKITKEENITKIIINKVSKEENKPLSDVEFKITDDKNNSIFIGKTNDKGVLVIEKLIPGKYFIEEIKTKDGYKKLEDKVEVDIKYNEEKEIKIINDKIKVEVKIVEEKKEKLEQNKEIKKRILPKTGY